MCLYFPGWMSRSWKSSPELPGASVERGAFVVRAGDSTDSLYVLLAGRAKVTNTDEEGGRSFCLAGAG
jgi:hypothetical protein